jgi:glutamate/aspartate transport system substrate-binding protein
MLRAFLFLAAIIGAASGASAQELEGRLKQIYESKIIRLAYRLDANPFSFVSPQGQPDGYTIDLCKHIAGSLERQISTKLAIEWVPVDSQNRFDSIAAGVADIECGSSSVSFARMTKVDFSSFIFMENTGLMVRVNSGIDNFADLKGKKIAVIVGTTNEVALTNEIQRRQLQTAVVRVRDRREGITALRSGAVDSFASDKLLLIGAPNADGRPTGCSRKAFPLSRTPSRYQEGIGDFELLSTRRFRNSTVAHKSSTSIGNGSLL